MNPNTTIIVMGPESCGNRITAEICCRLTGLPLMPHTVVGADVPKYLHEHGPQVMVRSLPHGGHDSPEGRQFYRADELVMECSNAKQDFRFVIPLRDRSISTASKCLLHTRDCGGREVAEQEQRRAVNAITLALACFPEQTLLWSYETLIWLGDAYISMLADWLGATFLRMNFADLEITDGNPKYLKGTP